MNNRRRLFGLGFDPRNRCSRFAVEPLETRTMLTAVVVNTALDEIFSPSSGMVSLRNAIATANSSTSPTTITFSPTVFATAQTIKQNGNALELSNKSEPTTITGPAAGVTLNGENAVGGLQIEPGVTVNLSNFTITNVKGVDGGIFNAGKLTLNDVTVSGNSAGAGAGIYNNGTLSLTNVMLWNNDADAGSAGGLYNGGTATLTDVTVLGNTASAGPGGGIYNDGVGTLTLINSTLCGNAAPDGGGGALDNAGTASLFDVTITGNTSEGPGGGIDNVGKTFNIANTIVEGKSSTTSPDVFGSFISKGFNLIGNTNGSSGWKSTDLTGAPGKPLSADLGDLGHNGGYSETILPLAGSPAIGAGSVALIPKGITTDQRGLPRTVNGKVDIGAVELQPAVVVSITVTAPSAQTATAGQSASISLGSFKESGATGPYKATVNWGDGSANSTLSLTAAATIPATAHTFAKSGTITVSVTVTDSAGHASSAATFKVTVAAIVATASISGEVFNDANGNGKLDPGEEGLHLWTVYIDKTDDGKLIAGDPSVVTNVDGDWSFTGLVAGTFIIRIVEISGSVTTTPASGALTITVKAGQASTGNLFGEKTIG